MFNSNVSFSDLESLCTVINEFNSFYGKAVFPVAPIYYQSKVHGKVAKYITLKGKYVRVRIGDTETHSTLAIAGKTHCGWKTGDGKIFRASKVSSFVMNDFIANREKTATYAKGFKGSWVEVNYKQRMLIQKTPLTKWVRMSKPAQAAWRKEMAGQGIPVSSPHIVSLAVMTRVDAETLQLFKDFAKSYTGVEVKNPFIQALIGEEKTDTLPTSTKRKVTRTSRKATKK